MFFSRNIDFNVEIIVKMSPIVKVEMSPKKYDKIISIIINHKKNIWITI